MRRIPECSYRAEERRIKGGQRRGDEGRLGEGVMSSRIRESGGMLGMRSGCEERNEGKGEEED